MRFAAAAKSRVTKTTESRMYFVAITKVSPVKKGRKKHNNSFLMMQLMVMPTWSAVADECQPHHAVGPPPQTPPMMQEELLRA